MYVGEFATKIPHFTKTKNLIGQRLQTTGFTMFTGLTAEDLGSRIYKGRIDGDSYYTM